MTSIDKLIFWLEDGKQIGTVFEFYKDNQKYWSSIGVQKWGNAFKVYIDEILEEEMDAENYTREEIRLFNCAVEALNFIKNYSNADIEKLSPCKGQKIFNPSFHIER